MRLSSGLRVLALILLLASAAPTILAISGVDDPDLLLVVFLPSVLVGVGTALVSVRPPSDGKAWVVDSQRMP